MSSNQRHQFRIPDSRNALLKLGRNRQSIVQLKDVSGSGFAIQSESRLPIEPNTSYPLRTSAGWSDVCLIYQHESTEGFIYGLLRIRDRRDPRSDKRVLSPNAAHSLTHRPPQERLASFWAFVLIGFGLFVFAGYAYTHKLPWEMIADLWSG